MDARRLIRRVCSLTLVIALSIIGIPLPVHAADEESPVVARSRVLTIRGQPLWRLHNAPPSGFTLPGLLV